MYNVRKLAQMAAYFLHRNGGAPMEHVKLMKLMYLADREAMNIYGFPISNDEYYSMRMGPVLSLTLDLMGGNEGVEAQREWGEWVSDKENYQVSLQKKEMTESDLDELADEEISVLRKIFDSFCDWTMNRLIDYTHTLKEWIDPGSGRLPITLRSIFEALEKPAAEIEAKLKYLTTAKPNTAFSPITKSSLLSRIDNFRSVPPPYPGAYTEKLDALFSGR